MLYRFKSRATADLILLPDDGETVLRLLGKLPSPSGIITVEQLPGAMATLEEVARQDRAATRAAQATDAEHSAKDPRREPRAQPTRPVGNPYRAVYNPPAGEDCEDDIDDMVDGDSSVSLAQRLAPFVAMLGHARREGQPVVWGV